MNYAATPYELAVYEETYKDFNQFMKDLREACVKGDTESKQLTEKHAPEMALALQKFDEWEDIVDVLMDKVLNVTNLEPEECASILRMIFIYSTFALS